MVVLLFGPAVVSTGGPDWPLPVTWRSKNGFMRYPGAIAQDADVYHNLSLYGGMHPVLF